MVNAYIYLRILYALSLVFIIRFFQKRKKSIIKNMLPNLLYFAVSWGMAFNIIKNSAILS